MVGQHEGLLGLEGVGDQPLLLQGTFVHLAVSAEVRVVAQNLLRFYLDHRSWIKYY